MNNENNSNNLFNEENNNVNPIPINQGPNPNNNLAPDPNQTNLNTVLEGTNSTTTPIISNTQPQNNISNPIPQNYQNNLTPQSNQSIGINPVVPNNMANVQPQLNTQNVTPTDTNNLANVTNNDEELLKSFIGNNFDKIAKKTFNFAGFFFSTFYMFYRKMFLYGLLLAIIDLVIINFFGIYYFSLVLNVLVGIFVNKIYLSYAKKEITKIKQQNSQKDFNHLKELCAAKGGTSVGQIFLGFLAEFGIALAIIIIMLVSGINNAVLNFFNLSNWNINFGGGVDSSSEDSTNSTEDTILLEDVNLVGSACLGSSCNLSFEEGNNYVDYALKAQNTELITSLMDYKDYVKLNIYYTQSGNSKTIVDYKVYLKSTNEDISNLKNEDELRDKIGLYSEGMHTETLTLVKTGSTGAGFRDDESYTYLSCTFMDSNNNEYEMKYINHDPAINLVENQKYNLTFEVVKNILNYEYYIRSIN